MGFEDGVGIDVFDAGDDEEGDRLNTFSDISIISRPDIGRYHWLVIFISSFEYSITVFDFGKDINYRAALK